MKDGLIRKTRVWRLRKKLICPFRTSLGQHDILDNVMMSLELGGGIRGFGEAAVATHITGETIEETSANLSRFAVRIIGRDIVDYAAVAGEAREFLGSNKAALAAVETALLDVLTRRLGIPLWRFFGPRAGKLSTDVTIVISDVEDSVRAAREFRRKGFRVFKIKIGSDPDSDYKRVRAVQKIIGRSRIYLDANQRYTAEQTLELLKGLRKGGCIPDLLEQPVPKNDVEGLTKVTRSTKVPVCADESARSIPDCLNLIRRKACRVINIKIMKTGIFEAREIVSLAKAAGLELMAGGMMETSLAMTASAHLAAGLGGFRYIDLDTPFFIKGGRIGNSYLSPSGVYDLSKVKAGIGIIPDR
jgi:L-alanine-DL-glutamate epimerase-like enolase superfamily enzyme